MPHVLAYLCGLPDELTVQRQAVAAYAAERGLTVDRWFADQCRWTVPLLRRPQGRAFLTGLDHGDVAVFARLDWSFPGWRDLRAQLEGFGRCRVVAHFVDLGVASDTADGRLALRALAYAAAWQHGRLSERLRESVDERRAQGRRINQAPVGGYGYRVTKDGREVRVREELWTVRQIVLARDRDSPTPWDGLWRWLVLEMRWCERCAQPVPPDKRWQPQRKCPECGRRLRPVHTRDGRPWSRRRIQRAYEAHLRPSEV
jgi:DNA invertase Pin-like site-specific DNA recombinase